MAEDYNRQWRNFFINRALQLRLLFVSLGYMAIMLAITLGFTLLPVVREMFTTTDPEVQYRSAQTFIILARRLVPSMLLLFFLFSIHLIVMTHRICGPLVNFSHTFERMAEGDFSRRITLRRRDHLKPEASMLNEVLGNISEHVELLQTESAALSETLKEAEASPSQENLTKVRVHQEKLKELVEAFRI